MIWRHSGWFEWRWSHDWLDNIMDTFHAKIVYNLTALTWIGGHLK